MTLKGKVAVVTGGARDIGRAVCMIATKFHDDFTKDEGDHSHSKYLERSLNLKLTS